MPNSTAPNRPQNLLRTLIVAEFVLIILSVVVSHLTEASLPEPLRQFVEAQAEAELTSRDTLLLVAAIPMLILFFISTVGLFFFWPPARLIYLLAIIFGYLLTPFAGPYVDAGWATTIDYIASLISGIILALIYFSPLKNLFEKPKPVNPDAPSS